MKRKRAKKFRKDKKEQNWFLPWKKGNQQICLEAVQIRS